MSNYIVTATFLNLRSEPKVHPENRIAELPQGQVVKKLGVALSNPKWFEIETLMHHVLFKGFVHSDYLKPAEDIQFPTAQLFKEVHLSPAKAGRNDRESGWPFPLKQEPDTPSRQASDTETNRRKDLLEIVDWLAVESSLRYAPRQNTYCNIYAYDYCYLAGAYLPRVWWKTPDQTNIEAGTTTPVIYDLTVQELSANSLYAWLHNFGEKFGWRRLGTVKELQHEANEGKVAVISAKHKLTNKSGHIAVVIPEHSVWKAKESQAVFIPVQSQAGRNNRAKFNDARWWLLSDFQAFSFWVHE